MASLLAELDPAVYVLDCVANLFENEVAERVEPFVRILRKARPTTPILLVENETYPASFILKPLQQSNARIREALRAAFGLLLAAGAGNLHYLAGDELLGDDGEATVDGTHPNDLGFLRIACMMGSALQPLLERAR